MAPEIVLAPVGAPRTSTPAGTVDSLTEPGYVPLSTRITSPECSGWAASLSTPWSVSFGLLGERPELASFPGAMVKMSSAAPALT